METKYEDLLDFIQQGALAYFQDRCNPTNGLVADSTVQNATSSIAAVGLALANYPLAGIGRRCPAQRELADELYQRVEWLWVLNDDLTIKHGWFPESGFIPYCWQGYDESLFLQILALGSKNGSVPAGTYPAWASTFRWETHYGYELVHAAPLFIHQAAHLWLDLRGILDETMRAKEIDYFENTCRATYVQQLLTRRNISPTKG